MRTWTADTTNPERAWALLSRPDQWSTWAPHVRGAWGLGEPEVREGAMGAARLLGVLPVPAKITAKSRRSWTWRVGPATMVHRIDGRTVAIDLSAPGPLEPALAAAYGPVIQHMLNRLAQLSS